MSGAECKVRSLMIIVLKHINSLLLLLLTKTVLSSGKILQCVSLILLLRIFHRVCKEYQDSDMAANLVFNL